MTVITCCQLGPRVGELEANIDASVAAVAEAVDDGAAIVVLPELATSGYVFEDAESVKIVAEVPGVNPEDVKLSMEGNVLTIRGEKKQQAEEKTERVHRYERSYGWFERAFSLPNTVDPDRIEAKVEQGVLTVLLPKAERARPREIPVKAS